MKVIGLCGGSGSGKGTASLLFAEHGFIAIDTDKVYHALTTTSTDCLRELVDEFGEGILNESGTLDRRKLAAIVFSDGADKQKHAVLNRIAHTHVLRRVRELISEYEKEGYAAVLVDAPMLFESGFDKECDAIIAVVADKDARVERIVSRDSISRQAALARIAAQLSDEYLIAHSDYTIYNDDISMLPDRVSSVAEKILKL